jgi:hypothetical protein
MDDAAASPAAAGLSVPPHRGLQYRRVLRQLHRDLRPRGYVEVGVQAGLTLELAECASIGVDPRFVLKAPALMGRKPQLMLFQTTSDDFFARHDPPSCSACRISTCSSSTGCTMRTRCCATS